MAYTGASCHTPVPRVIHRSLVIPWSMKSQIEQLRAQKKAQDRAAVKAVHRFDKDRAHQASAIDDAKKRMVAARIAAAAQRQREDDEEWSKAHAARRQEAAANVAAWREAREKRRREATSMERKAKKDEAEAVKRNHSRASVAGMGDATPRNESHVPRPPSGHSSSHSHLYHGQTRAEDIQPLRQGRRPRPVSATSRSAPSRPNQGQQQQQQQHPHQSSGDDDDDDEGSLPPIHSPPRDAATGATRSAAAAADRGASTHASSSASGGAKAGARETPRGVSAKDAASSANGGGGTHATSSSSARAVHADQRHRLCGLCGRRFTSAANLMLHEATCATAFMEPNAGTHVRENPPRRGGGRPPARPLSSRSMDASGNGDGDGDGDSDGDGDEDEEWEHHSHASRRSAKSESHAGARRARSKNPASSASSGPDIGIGGSGPPPRAQRSASSVGVGVGRRANGASGKSGNANRNRSHTPSARSAAGGPGVPPPHRRSSSEAGIGVGGKQGKEAVGVAPPRPESASRERRREQSPRERSPRPSWHTEREAPSSPPSSQSPRSSNGYEQGYRPAPRHTSFHKGHASFEDHFSKFFSKFSGPETGGNGGGDGSSGGRRDGGAGFASFSGARAGAEPATGAGSGAGSTSWDYGMRGGAGAGTAHRNDRNDRNADHHTAALRAEHDAKSDRLLIDTYEQNWSVLLRVYSKQDVGATASPRPLRFEDVPWLPELSSSAREACGGGEPFPLLGCSETASTAEKNKAIRRASLRWHPDKFIQAFGRHIAPEDRERVLDSVKRMSQRVNHFKERL